MAWESSGYNSTTRPSGSRCTYDSPYPGSSPYTDQNQYLWLSIPFYNLSLVLSKLSALILYIRIFPSKRFRLAVYLAVGFLVLSGLWMVLSGFVFCVPVKDFWSLDPTVKKSHCLSMGAVWYTNAGLQIFTDIVILILPMPMVSNLQLPQRQKVGIMLVFGVGIL